MNRFSLNGLIVTLAVCISCGSASAVIKVLTPLKDVLAGTPIIFTAGVGKIDPEKPSVVFNFVENLKGTCLVKTLPVNLTGDTFAKKEQHAKVMIDRLVVGGSLIIFANKEGKTYQAFGFMEGTWFQLQGTEDADGITVRWAFLHCEPYFRRTFKGTTAELVEVVKASLANTKAPPAPDEKEPAGFGPLPKKMTLAPQRSRGLFAVIPSVVLIGPLAIIAALFPGVFARLAIGMKRWRAFLVVASFISTTAIVYLLLASSLPDSRWVSPHFVLMYLTCSVAIGMIWSGLRYRRIAATDPAETQTPTRNDLFAILGTAVGALVLVGITAYFFGEKSIVEIPGREFTGIAIGLCFAAIYTPYRMVTRRVDTPSQPTRVSLSGESVALFGLLVAGVVANFSSWPIAKSSVETVGERGEAFDARSQSSPKLSDVRTTTFDNANEVLSQVRIAPDGSWYFGTMRKSGFATSGTVNGTDANGKERWTFTNDGALKPVFCTPTVAGGLVFVGEGLHTDADRKLFALDAATGVARWSIATTSHTEGTPRVEAGIVYFSAGDDGFYAADATTGAVKWHIEGVPNKLHIDTPPAVAGGRVFVGSGYNTLTLLAYDATSGQELWRREVPLRSFGAPVVRGEVVYFGLGTGNLSDDLSTEPEQGVPAETEPRGAVIALNTKSGEILWQYDLPRSVHTELGHDAQSIYVCCKNGTVYALDRTTGKLRWSRQLGTAFAAGPAVMSYAAGAATVAVYAVTQDGVAVCMNPTTGTPYWTRDLSEATGKKIQVFSTPTIQPSADGRTRTLTFGGAMENTNNGLKKAVVIQIDDVIND